MLIEAAWNGAQSFAVVEFYTYPGPGSIAAPGTNPCHILHHLANDISYQDGVCCKRDENMEATIEIVVCYAHDDEKYLQRLQQHLRALQRQEPISVWCDRSISPGATWENEILAHLESAQIILLLVSRNFMDSDYCWNVEVKVALERSGRGEARVIPIIIEPVFWRDGPLGKLQALPKDGKPIRSPSWHSQDEAFFEVAEGIHSVIEEIKKQSSAFPLSSQLLEQNEKILQDTDMHEQSLSGKFLTVPEVHPGLVGLISADDGSQKFGSRYSEVAVDEESQHSRRTQKRRQRHLSKRSLLVSLAILLVLMSPLLPSLSRPLCFLTVCHSSQQPSSQNEGEVRDQNLAVQFIGTQQNTFVLPGDPSRLNPNQLLKQGVPALCIDQPKQQVPTIFRIAIGISNLRRDQYVLLIEQVQIIVEQIASIPHPLYALMQNLPALSNYNLYRGTYTGGDTNVPVVTTYDYPPYSYVFLTLHETDRISIQIASLVEVFLSFRIAITYRVANEGQTHTLTLPTLFRIIFSDKSNLHLYQKLQDGHLSQLDTP